MYLHISIPLTSSLNTGCFCRLDKARWNRKQSNLFTTGLSSPKIKNKNTKTTLSTELLDLLEERGGLALEEIKEIMKDSPFLADTNQAGKRINFALINMKRYGYATFQNNKWDVTAKKFGSG